MTNSVMCSIRTGIDQKLFRGDATGLTQTFSAERLRAATPLSPRAPQPTRSELLGPQSLNLSATGWETFQKPADSLGFARTGATLPPRALNGQSSAQARKRAGNTAPGPSLEEGPPVIPRCGLTRRRSSAHAPSPSRDVWTRECTGLYPLHTQPAMIFRRLSIVP